MADTVVPSQPLPELKARNAYVSSPSGLRPAKETTFREWVVANQIGMKNTPILGLIWRYRHDLYLTESLRSSNPRDLRNPPHPDNTSNANTNLLLYRNLLDHPGYVAGSS